MKTLLTLIFLVFFTSSVFAQPSTYKAEDTFPLHPLPFKFSQVVNGLRKMVERDCGHCKFYDFESPLPKESANQEFILLNDRFIGRFPYRYPYRLKSIIISCPALTGIDGILELEFKVENNGELVFYQANELSSILFLKYYRDAGNMVAASLFEKLENFYGWNEKRDTKYDGNLIDLSNLNKLSGRFKWPGYDEGGEINWGNSSFENVKYSFLILSIRTFQWFETDSYIFYTDINSPGYIADKDFRAVQDHIVKLTTDDGQEILRFNFASPGRPKGPVSLVFKPDPERKTLKLSKVLVGKKEIDPNDASLRRFWEYLAQCLEMFNRSG